jgi:hypothetical protein
MVIKDSTSLIIICTEKVLYNMLNLREKYRLLKKVNLISPLEKDFVVMLLTIIKAEK